MTEEELIKREHKLIAQLEQAQIKIAKMLFNKHKFHSYKGYILEFDRLANNLRNTVAESRAHCIERHGKDL